VAKRIPLAGGKYAIVDDKDWPKLMKHNWYCHTGYAARNGPKIRGKRTCTIFMHRVLCPAPKGYEVDHINGNKLDNRKSNLRVATRQQQLFNRRANTKNTYSKYKGVYWSKEKRLWRALIKKNGVSRHLGYFESEIDAAIAYNTKALELFGKFARLNSVPVKKDWWKKRTFIQSNSTGFRGVTKVSKDRWQARITVNGQRKSLGYYASPLEAAKAYNEAAIKYYGERALLNEFKNN
jgi:hypothetical protein